MSQKKLRVLFAASTLGLYLMLSVPALVLAVRNHLEWLLFATLFECLALAMALELNELSFGLLLPVRTHAKVAGVDRTCIRLAVLYLCCDDADEESLRSLVHLYGVSIFILDDSAVPISLPETEYPRITVIRRGDRSGFKAGNLNYWLNRYGAQFDYFVVLDSDSIVSLDAIWELVAYAEHPTNRDIAIVQSMICARTGNHFQSAVSAQQRVRFRILSRLYDRIGWTISHGHNNLHRTKAIRELGGFGLDVSCEDTIASVQLALRGWRLILVDVVTYDSEPGDVFAFRRRQVRWARQTTEVITASETRVTWLHGLLLTRHVLSYVVPFICVALLALVSIRGALGAGDIVSLLRRNLMLRPGHVLLGLVTYGLFGGSMSIVLLQLVAAVREGGSRRMFFLSACLNGAVLSFCCINVMVGVLRSLLMDRADFVPTGHRSKETKYSFVEIWRAMWMPWLIYGGIAAVLLSKPPLLALGFNLLWITTLISAPFVLYLFHRDQIEMDGHRK